MNNPLLAIQSQYWAVRDYLSPVLKQSKFKEHGRLTPEEFVAAGDFLSEKFGVWSWQKGDANRVRDFLPADKQYLITRNVPCLRRATAVEYGNDEEDGERLLNFLDEAEEAPGFEGENRPKAGAGNDEDSWVETHVGRTSHSKTSLADIPDMDDDEPSPANPTSSAQLTSDLNKLNLDKEKDQDKVPDMDDIPDMDDDADGGFGLGGEAVMLEEEEDEAEAKGAVLRHPTAQEVESSNTRENLLQVRTYDCLISYDKHYQTPRFWLLGYDENKKPLTPTQVFQDVPSDHAFKTMTMETFPHSGQLLASVHPCKHASVMKKFIDRMDAAQKGGANSTSSGGSGAVEEVGGPGEGEKKKKGWGVPSIVRKVTGGSTSSAALREKEKQEAAVAEQTGLQVDFYLVIFLKFIASIVPTIEVDSTTSI